MPTLHGADILVYFSHPMSLCWDVTSMRGPCQPLLSLDTTIKTHHSPWALEECSTLLYITSFKNYFSDMKILGKRTFHGKYSQILKNIIFK